MARKFQELREKMSPERRARNERAYLELRAELPLDELREARKITQEQLAETLNIKQASVSKMERRADMYISSLRKIVEAMGGELEIVASFPDGRVKITQFHALEK